MEYGDTMMHKRGCDCCAVTEDVLHVLKEIVGYIEAYMIDPECCEQDCNKEMLQMSIKTAKEVIYEVSIK